MLKIAVVAYDNCLQSGIAGMLDLFALANWESRRLHPNRKGLFCRVEVVTEDGRPATSFNRQPIVPGASVENCNDPDLIIVPGMLGRPETLLEYKGLVAWVGERHRRGKVVASACTGAFLLAEAGILDRRQATTHWQLADRFRQRFPRVDLQVDRILVEGGDYLTAGGTGAHSDLALALIERYGSRPLAAACGRMMLIDCGRRDQAPFVRFRGCRDHGDTPILDIQQWLDRFYRQKVTVREMVRRSGLNERTFLRRFRKATGESPLEYLQRLRVEKAKQMLLKTDRSLEEITRAVGYVDISSFRRLFKQTAGLSPVVYRRRFGG